MHDVLVEGEVLVAFSNAAVGPSTANSASYCATEEYWHTFTTRVWRQSIVDFFNLQNKPNVGRGSHNGGFGTNLCRSQIRGLSMLYGQNRRPNISHLVFHCEAICRWEFNVCVQMDRLHLQQVNSIHRHRSHIAVATP